MSQNNPSTSLVKYGSFELEAAEEEQKDIDQSGGAFFKLKAGRNVVRFPPPPVGARSPFLKVHQHFVQFPGMAKAASFNCPRLMSKLPCPVCKKCDELRATGNPADYELAGEYLAKPRVFANIIDRANPEAGPQIIAFGKKIHESLVALRTDEVAGGDFTHPETGFDIVITRSGTTKNDTEYEVKASRKITPLGNMEWLEQLHDLGRLGRVPSGEDILRMLGGPARANVGGGRSRTAGDDVDQT